MSSKKNVLIWGVVIILIILASGLLIWFAYRPGKLDGFAQCLKDKGATFYGAFWCPHCQKQKTLFGPSAKLLAYVECSAPDGRGQLPVCDEKKIVSYPTWDFADSTRETGEISLERLAEKTGCPLSK